MRENIHPERDGQAERLRAATRQADREFGITGEEEFLNLVRPGRSKPQRFRVVARRKPRQGETYREELWALRATAGPEVFNIEHDILEEIE